MKISDITIKNEDYDITDENFENVLGVFTDDDGYYFFNLLSTVTFPEDMDPETYGVYRVLPDDFYTTISYKFYGTIKLWWIICAANQVLDPTSPPPIGVYLRIPKTSVVTQVLTTIKGRK